MAWFPIGESSYGDLRGQMQYVNSERIAQQWLSLVRDFWVRFGVRLSPNEGKRSKERCEQLFAKYLRDGYPVAAALYLSRHYEGTHGNAIDAGVTEADGTNRALTDEEFAWLHEQCELRGFTWTGRFFGEPWHIEGATRREHFPPYPGITTTNVILADQEEDDMFSDNDEARLQRVEAQAKQTLELARGIHTMLSDKDSGISVRVHTTMRTAERIEALAKSILREFTHPDRGVIVRMKSLLTRTKRIEKAIVPADQIPADDAKGSI